jgi:ferritin-like metal-binding protein YciE
MPKTSNKKTPPSASKTPPPTSLKKSKGKTPDQAMLFNSCIQEIYWAENHLVANLPKVQEAAGDKALKDTIAGHLKVTKGHVRRLEEIFELLGQPKLAKKSDAMEGLVMEGEAVINTTAAASPARNTGLIMACQKVEQYEIAAYRGLSLLATQLGYPDISKLLSDTLQEEESADDALSTLAKKG